MILVLESRWFLLLNGLFIQAYDNTVGKIAESLYSMSVKKKNWANRKDCMSVDSVLDLLVVPEIKVRVGGVD